MGFRRVASAFRPTRTKAGRVVVGLLLVGLGAAVVDANRRLEDLSDAVETANADVDELRSDGAATKEALRQVAGAVSGSAGDLAESVRALEYDLDDLRAATVGVFGTSGPALADEIDDLESAVSLVAQRVDQAQADVFAVDSCLRRLYVSVTDSPYTGLRASVDC